MQETFALANVATKSDRRIALLALLLIGSLIIHLYFMRKWIGKYGGTNSQELQIINARIDDLCGLVGESLDER